MNAKKTGSLTIVRDSHELVRLLSKKIKDKSPQDTKSETQISSSNRTAGIRGKCLVRACFMLAQTVSYSALSFNLPCGPKEVVDSTGCSLASSGVPFHRMYAGTGGKAGENEQARLYARMKCQRSSSVLSTYASPDESPRHQSECQDRAVHSDRLSGVGRAYIFTSSNVRQRWLRGIFWCQPF